jgi:c-di-GMP-binding flagellar brake protein YcgR
MKLSDLEMGTKLELELTDIQGQRLEPILVSELEWFAGKNEAVIAAPIFEGSVVPLHIGTIMNVYFIKKRENDIHLYKLEAEVMARETSENLHLLRIRIQGEPEKVQRREYYRLSCSVEVRYRIVDYLNEVYNENIGFKRTFARNISGGGVCLLLEDKVEVGSILECEVHPEGDRMIRFFGQVVRYDKSEREGRFKYEAGIAYIRINESDRETVVRFIFEEQRKMRKKGLI